MIKTLLLSTIAFGSLAAQAQSTNYTMLHSDPNDYRRTTVYLDLFTADTYLNPNLGSAFKLETVLGQTLMPYLGVKYSWADANTNHVVSGFPTSANGLKKQMIIDAGTAFFFTHGNKNKRVKVVLSSHSFGGYTFTQYIMVPSTIKRMFGVEGGLYYNRRALEFDDNSHSLYHYKGTAVGSYEGPIGEAGNSPGSASAPTGESYKPLSMTHVVSLYGGIHYRRVTNTSIEASGYGTCSNRTIVDWYADVMLAPYIPIANVVDNTGQTFEIVPESGALNHLGYRAGITYHTAKAVSFEYNFELGKKPGPQMGTSFLNNGSYISLGMGLSIGFNKQFSTKSKTVTKSKTTTNEPEEKAEN